MLAQNLISPFKVDDLMNKTVLLCFSEVLHTTIKRNASFIQNSDPTRSSLLYNEEMGKHWGQKL